ARDSSEVPRAERPGRARLRRSLLRDRGAAARAGAGEPGAAPDLSAASGPATPSTPRTVGGVAPSQRAVVRGPTTGGRATRRPRIARAERREGALGRALQSELRPTPTARGATTVRPR